MSTMVCSIHICKPSADISNLETVEILRLELDTVLALQYLLTLSTFELCVCFGQIYKLSFLIMEFVCDLKGLILQKDK